MKRTRFFFSVAVMGLLALVANAGAQSTTQSQTYQNSQTTTVINGQGKVNQSTSQTSTTVVKPQQVITVPAEPIVKSTSPVYDNALQEPIEPEVLPPQTSDNGIQYINGGVGESERKAIQMVQNQYNLKIMTSDRQGRFVSHSALSIFDDNNQSVLNVTDLGPVFLAKLPPGKYRAAVIYQGETKSQNFTVGNRPKALSFLW